jgi:hypothetical protein
LPLTEEFRDLSHVRWTSAGVYPNWAGVPVTKLRPVVERMTLRRYRGDKGAEMLDLTEAPLPGAGAVAPVRYLHTWEAALLAHARRSGILLEVYRARVFNTRTPHSVPTFLVDGAVAGTWRYEKGRILLEPFQPLQAAVKRELDEEAERLAAFHS